jgi:hypothetical protein
VAQEWLKEKKAMDPKALDSTKDLNLSKRRMSAKAADYMELDGAEKDADCEKVEVEGGVSSSRGCCNEFSPDPGAKKFSCGTCTYLNPD